MELWITRDSNDVEDPKLWLWIDECPELWNGKRWSGFEGFELDFNEFSEITFENSPKRVELKVLDEK